MGELENPSFVMAFVLFVFFFSCPLAVVGEAECSEQHFCACPPFLRPSRPSQLHFTKHNYGEQYAIVGKSKELHCCFGPEWDSIQWSKDGMAYPWGSRISRRNSILYSHNQSLIMMEVGQLDSGTYTCEARRGEEVLRHSTDLQSFPAPVFAHPPIWNNPPSDVAVPLGQPATLGCSATVGQQYNTVSMEPVHAAWIRFGQEVESTPGKVEVEQTWTDDDIVTHLRLRLASVEKEDEGEYMCSIHTEYGLLESPATLEIISEKSGQVKNKAEKEFQNILQEQLQIYNQLTGLFQSDPPSFEEMLERAKKKLE